MAARLETRQRILHHMSFDIAKSRFDAYVFQLVRCGGAVSVSCKSTFGVSAVHLWVHCSMI